MKKVFFSAAALMAFAQAAAASCGPGGTACVAVPEISALEGTAALAALAAIVLLVWERRRRAA